MIRTPSLVLVLEHLLEMMCFFDNSKEVQDINENKTVCIRIYVQPLVSEAQLSQFISYCLKPSYSRMLVILLCWVRHIVSSPHRQVKIAQYHKGIALKRFLLI